MVCKKVSRDDRTLHAFDINLSSGDLFKPPVTTTGYAENLHEPEPLYDTGDIHETMQSPQVGKKTRQALLNAPQMRKASMPSRASLDRFRIALRDFYHAHGRDMPWRTTTNPYHILVSEVMLQQTSVERTVAKYGEFITAFPDFPALAYAPLDTVLRVWQGMGYNRRAIALMRIAGLVVDEYSGILPSDPAVLATFPGIGKATAASIAAFAFNAPVVFIETNIRRVFIYCFFQDRSDVHDREIEPLVAATLDRENPREWYWALMDYGTHMKKTQENPNRKSAHYTRQPPFEGSRRQLRGKILRALLDRPGMKESELAAATGAEPELLREVLEEFRIEGFITRKRDKLTIVKDRGSIP
jgi:A/G-specific adenine glycosylase